MQFLLLTLGAPTKLYISSEMEEVEEGGRRVKAEAQGPARRKKRREARSGADPVDLSLLMVSWYQDMVSFIYCAVLLLLLLGRLVNDKGDRPKEGINWAGARRKGGGKQTRANLERGHHKHG